MRLFNSAKVRFVQTHKKSFLIMKIRALVSSEEPLEYNQEHTLLEQLRAVIIFLDLL